MSAPVWITNSHHHEEQSFDADYELIDTDAYSQIQLEFGVLRRCKRKYDGCLFAVKKIEKSVLAEISNGNEQVHQLLVESIRNEIDILLHLDHKYLVNIHELYETQHTLYLIVDDCIGGQLYHRLKRQKRINEMDCKRIMKQILTALHYMHDQHLCIHCDLTVNNVWFTRAHHDSNHIKLCNFGMSQILPHLTDIAVDKLVTHYTAPEVIASSNNYSHVSDMWSAGILCFAMMFGFEPFSVNASGHGIQHDLSKSIRSGFEPKIKKGFGAWFPASMSGIISREAMDFMCRLLETNPNKRMRAKKALQHTWLKDVTLSTIEFPQRKQSADIVHVVHSETKRQDECKSDKARLRNGALNRLSISRRSSDGGNVSPQSLQAAINNGKLQDIIDDQEQDHVYSMQRVRLALRHNDEHEIMAMFRSLMEQNREYEQKLKRVQQENETLRNALNDHEQQKSVPHLRPKSQSQCRSQGWSRSVTELSEELVDVMTPLNVNTPFRTDATPIYGVDL